MTTSRRLGWPLLALIPWVALLGLAWVFLIVTQFIAPTAPCLTGLTAPWAFPMAIAYAASLVVMAMAFAVGLVLGPSGTRIAAWGLVWIGLPLAALVLFIWIAAYGWHC